MNISVVEKRKGLWFRSRVGIGRLGQLGQRSDVELLLFGGELLLGGDHLRGRRGEGPCGGELCRAELAAAPSSASSEHIAPNARPLAASPGRRLQGQVRPHSASRRQPGHSVQERHSSPGAKGWQQQQQPQLAQYA